MTPTRVLVADDDDEIREAIAQSLAEDGMKVEEARSGSELLAILGQNGIDLLVTDVFMPELGGVHAATMVRAVEVDIPILVMTAHRDAWIAESVRKLPCADLLYKPFTTGELVEHVHGLLKRRGDAT